MLLAKTLNPLVVIVGLLVASVAWPARGGIVHRYLMEDGAGTTIADSSDSVDKSPGTAISWNNGTGGWTTGRFGGAWQNLSSGYLSFPALGLPTDQGSFVQWVKISDKAGAWSNPLATHIQVSTPSTAGPMRNEVSGSKTLHIYAIPNGTNGTPMIDTSVLIADNQWHQIVTTYDKTANKTRVFVDGIPRGSNAYNPSGLTSKTTWRLGMREEDGVGHCAAVYDSTAIYNEALTDSQVWELYRLAADGVTLGNRTPAKAGLRHLYTFDAGSHPLNTLVLDSQSNYDGTVTGGTWVADNPPRDLGGWKKAASGDMVQLPMVVNLQAGTYEGWFKSDPTSSDWTNPLATSIRATDEAHSYDSMRIELETDSPTDPTDSPAIHVYDTPGAGTFEKRGVNTADGLWHHLALSYEHGKHAKLYLDGVLLIESSANYNASLAYDRGFTMLGARSPTHPVGWWGTVGTLAYFDYALSAAEISAHYQTGLVPEPASLALAALGVLIGWPLLRRRRKRVGRS
jgi:hypothetical protein